MRMNRGTSTLDMRSGYESDDVDELAPGAQDGVTAPRIGPVTRFKEGEIVCSLRSQDAASQLVTVTWVR